MNIFKNFFAFMFLLSLSFCEAAEALSINTENQTFNYNASEKRWRNLEGVLMNAEDLGKYLFSAERKGRFNLRFSKDCISKLKEILDYQGEEYLQKIKDRLLAYGHLGYYPGVSFEQESFSRELLVNKMAPRGIFNVDSTIANRVFSKKLHYLSPVSNKGYQIDFGNDPSLEDWAVKIIDFVFGSPQRVDSILLAKVNQNKFYLDVKYKIMENEVLGFNKNGVASSIVRLEIETLNGFVEIIDMYPL